MLLSIDDVLKLILAMAVGGVIGAERELRDKAAGLRTLMFICTGSALFAILSGRLDPSHADQTRISAGIVTGIGFLGAGVILRERGEIHGLTTAAMIWFVAALGMGIGGGEYVLAVVATFLMLVVLILFPHIERRMNAVRQVRVFTVTTIASDQKYTTLCETLKKNNLRVVSARRSRQGDDMICTWYVSGRPDDLAAFENLLFNDPEVEKLEV